MGTLVEQTSRPVGKSAERDEQKKERMNQVFLFR